MVVRTEIQCITYFFCHLLSDTMKLLRLSFILYVHDSNWKLFSKHFQSELRITPQMEHKIRS